MLILIMIGLDMYKARNGISPASIETNDWTQDWRDAVNQSGQGGPGNSNLGNGGIMTMRVIDQPELVFEFHFHQWTCCSSGGGFSYTRYRIGPSGVPADFIVPNSSVLLT